MTYDPVFPIEQEQPGGAGVQNLQVRTREGGREEEKKCSRKAV